MPRVALLFALGLLMALLHRVTAGGPLEARATLALGFLLLVAYVGGELGRRARLPRLTGYLLVGFAVGPAWLGLVRREEVEALRLIEDAAMALIAFAAGAELTLDTLRQSRVAHRPRLRARPLPAAGAPGHGRVPRGHGVRRAGGGAAHGSRALDHRARGGVLSRELRAGRGRAPASRAETRVAADRCGVLRSDGCGAAGRRAGGSVAVDPAPRWPPAGGPALRHALGGVGSAGDTCPGAARLARAHIAGRDGGGARPARAAGVPRMGGLP